MFVLLQTFFVILVIKKNLNEIEEGGHYRKILTKNKILQ